MMMEMPAFAQADDQTQMRMQRSLGDKLVPEVYNMISMNAPPNVMMSYQQNRDRIEPMLRNYLDNFSLYAAMPKAGGTKVSLGPNETAKPESKPEAKPDQAQFDKALQFVSAQINDPQGDPNEYAAKIVAYLNSIGEFVNDANLSKYRDKIFDILDMTDDEIQKVIDQQMGEKPKGDIMGMSYSQIFLLVIAAVAVYAIIQNMMNLVKAAVVIGAGVLLYQFIKKNYLNNETK
jgi:hypothetical protein